jgi:hypothetical protein
MEHAGALVASHEFRRGWQFWLAKSPGIAVVATVSDAVYPI